MGITVTKGRRVYRVTDNKVQTKFLVRGVGSKAIEVMFYKSTDLDPVVEKTMEFVIKYAAAEAHKRGWRRVCLAQLSGAANFFHLFNRYEYKNRDKKTGWWEVQGFTMLKVMIDSFKFVLTDKKKYFMEIPYRKTLPSDRDFQNIWDEGPDRYQYFDPSELRRAWEKSYKRTPEEQATHDQIMKEILAAEPGDSDYKLDTPLGNSRPLRFVKHAFLNSKFPWLDAELEKKTINPEALDAFRQRANPQRGRPLSKLIFKAGELSPEDAARGYSWPITIETSDKKDKDE